MKPILSDGRMVRAILDGTQTQTRRVMRLRNGRWMSRECQCMLDPSNSTERDVIVHECPYGQPGAHLWLREPWRAIELESGLDVIEYRADGAIVPIENTQDAADRWMEQYREGDPWRPSIHMPKWAARIFLEITNVRVERVQDISDPDAQMEGCEPDPESMDRDIIDFVPSFRRLWDSINAKRGYSWESNPHVWVLGFKQIEHDRT